MKVLEPVASKCLMPQDCKHVEDEASVLFNWLSPEPGMMPCPGLHAVVSQQYLLTEGLGGKLHFRAGRAEPQWICPVSP